MIQKYKHILISILIVLLGASALWGWFRPNPPGASKTEYIPVPQEKIVTKIKTVTVPGPERIVTIDKPTIVEKLKLPDWLKEDKDKQVIANADIVPHKGHTSAVAIIDVKTGEAQILAKQLPPPFFDFEQTKEIGMRYGVSSDSGTAAAIYGRWTFARVGNIKAALYGEIDNDAKGKAQLDLRYEW